MEFYLVPFSKKNCDTAARRLAGACVRLDSCVGAWWWVIHDTIAVVKEVLDTVVCKVLPVTSNKWLQNTDKSMPCMETRGHCSS